MSKYTTVPCHINELRPGDTVLHNGGLITVCRRNLRRGGFMGTTLLGDSYRSGMNPVQRVLFPQFYRRQSIDASTEGTQ